MVNHTTAQDARIFLRLSIFTHSFTSTEIDGFVDVFSIHDGRNYELDSITAVITHRFIFFLSITFHLTQDITETLT